MAMTNRPPMANRSPISNRPPSGGDPSQPLEEDVPLSELISRLTTDVGDLVSTQVELAKVELKDEVAKAKQSAGMLGAGAFMGYLAVIMLSFALAWGLTEIVPEGVAFLIVGALYGAAAAVLLTRGKRQLAEVQAIPQTQASLKEDVQWAREQKS